jgi:hypothetical protein
MDVTFAKQIFPKPTEQPPRGCEKNGTGTFATAELPGFSSFRLGASPIFSQPPRVDAAKTSAATHAENDINRRLLRGMAPVDFTSDGTEHPVQAAPERAHDYDASHRDQGDHQAVLDHRGAFFFPHEILHIGQHCTNSS